MTYEEQVTELAEKMARELYELPLMRSEIESMRPVAVIALAFTAQKVRETYKNYDERFIIGTLQSLGLIPTT